MSRTIHDCASLSAEERRERRRQKILSNGEQRLSVILATENRDTAPTTEDPHPTTKEFSHQKVQPQRVIPKEETAKELGIMQPDYFEMMDSHRFVALMVLGVLFRLAVHFHLLQNVTLPFFLLSISYKLLCTQLRRNNNVSCGPQYPKHGYVVNFLMVGGLNERLVIGVGHCIDFLWEYVLEQMVISFAYLCTNAVMIALL